MTSTSQKQIIDYYDASEIDYRLVWRLGKAQALHYGFWQKGVSFLTHALINENKVLAEIASIKKADQVLDAGCGVGGSSIYLAKNIGCFCYGISLSSKQIENAKRNAANSGVSDLTDFSVQDFTKTNFPKNTFDVVWGVESICHAEKKLDFLKEAYRVLKPGGRLVIADFFQKSQNINSTNQFIMGQWTQGWSVSGFADFEEFQSLAKKAGFKIKGKYDFTKEITPSSKRLFMAFFPGVVISKLLKTFKVRNEIHHQNTWTAYYQYIALKKGLWGYHVLLATK